MPPHEDRLIRSPLAIVLAAFVLMLGPAFAGYMVHDGLLKFRGNDNYVTVKGLATADVEADLVLWPIKHTATGGDLPLVQQEVESNSRKIITFLKSKGLSDQDIVARKIEVTDLLAQQYRSDNAASSRFIVSETILIRTNEVAKIDQASQEVGELLKQGVSLVRDPNNQNTGYPEYIYTELNDIKPDMIAEATKSARESAQQFARDSNAKVGDIREAWQGQFEILPRDSNNSYEERQERFKTVRVVSTLKYYLD